MSGETMTTRLRSILDDARAHSARYVHIPIDDLEQIVKKMENDDARIDRLMNYLSQYARKG